MMVKRDLLVARNNPPREGKSKEAKEEVLPARNHGISILRQGGKLVKDDFPQKSLTTNLFHRLIPGAVGAIGIRERNVFAAQSLDRFL